MKLPISFRLPLTALVALSLVGCVAPVEESVETVQEELQSANALTANALTANALTANALTANALTANALTANALTANALTANGLKDPAAREVLKYITSCALPAGAHVDVTIDGTAYGFDGQIGLAPGWGEQGGSCDAACQGWVSACVLARLNYKGESVPISIRATPTLDSTPQERAEYARREATYYGNIFGTPQLRHACLSPGATTLPRVCGHSLDDCVVQITGSCDATCESPMWDGSFPNCHDGPKAAPETNVFPASITVFLK